MFYDQSEPWEWYTSIDRSIARRSTATGIRASARNHNAIAAAIAQQRADWGVAIECVAEQAGLGFLPVTEEQYDFVVPRVRATREAVQAFRDLLAEASVQQALSRLGCRVAPP